MSRSDLRLAPFNSKRNPVVRSGIAPGALTTSFSGVTRVQQLNNAQEEGGRPQGDNYRPVISSEQTIKLL